MGCILFLWFSLQNGTALAWNAAGHRLSAAIAWEELTPTVRSQVTNLLGAHPEADSWTKRWREPYAGILFSEASTWPDELRKSSPSDESEDHANHRDWHYIDWPVGVPRTQSRRGQLLIQLEQQARIVGDHGAPPKERAVALAWLIHLTGDAHQPLHSATWQINGRWTDGGNGHAVIDPDNPRLTETNLHRFWDDLPGPPWIRGKRLHERVTLMRQWRPSSQIQQGSPIDWVEESHALAMKDVVPTSPPPFTITADYRKRAEELADRRIVESAVRLGRWLNLLLSQEKR